MERGQRANRPSLPTDAIELRVKYHDPTILRRLIADLSQEWELTFQGLETRNEPQEYGRFYRFLRVRERRGRS